MAQKSVRATIIKIQNFSRSILENDPFLRSQLWDIEISFDFSSYHLSLTLSTATMTAIAKKVKHKELFQDSNIFDYALKITERHTHTRQILLPCCLFCIYIDHEYKLSETRVRQSTISSKDLKPSFHVELFRKHHERQH